MAFGVTTSGFVIKRLEDIKDEIESSLRAALGPEINLLPQAVFGQIVGIFSERESLVWELAEDVYNSQYPDTAEGVPLDNVVALTGTTRKEATKSTSQILAEGTALTVIPQGSVVSVQGDSEARFETDADATIAATISRIQRIDFDDVPDSGDWKLDYGGQVTNSLAYDISAATLETELEAIVGEALKIEGSMTDGWKIYFREPGTKLTLAEDTNNLLIGATPIVITIALQPGVAINVTAEDTGSTAAPADSLTVIETPIAGWDSSINTEDALIGRDLETDQELKLRRDEELGIAGRATLEAIRAQLIAITDVIAVVTFRNISAVEDPDGRPPHSLDIVVQGGDEDEIAETIFETIADGIETIGTISKTVVDSQGFNQTIKFSRPTEVEIYLEVDLSVDNNLFPSDGIAQAEAALLAHGNGLQVGEDVIVYPALVASLNDIPGITDVVIRIGEAPSPTLDNNITIEPREIADFDSTRIDVTVP